MKKAILLGSALLTLVSAMAQTKNFLDTPYLETNASIDTLVNPDKIYLSITIREKDSKGRKSVEEQEQKMGDRLKGLGIDLKKQLTIKDLASNYKKYFLRSKDVLKSKQFSLLVYDGLTAGKVMAALEDLDIANTYLEKTAYSKMDALELTLKSKAVQKAKAKAEALTRPLGQKIGPALHIVDGYSPTNVVNYAPRLQRETMAMAMKSEAQPLDISFEKIRV
ncbi:MAG: SIMPL domain-containing protein [Bacteroidota bacterium]